MANVTKVIYTPWYWTDWIADTCLLSPAEYWIYHNLLGLFYKGGGVPLTREQCERVAGILRMHCERNADDEQTQSERPAIDLRADCKASLDYVLRTYFIEKDGGYVNRRAVDEIAKINSKSQQARENASKRGKDKADAKQTQSKSKADAKQMQSESKADAEQTQNGRNASHKSISNNYYTSSNEDVDKGAAPSRSASPRARAASPTLNFYGLPEQLQKDWKTSRKKKLTQTAIDGVKREAEKAGITFEQAVRFLVERGWESFRASWWKNASSEEGTSEPDQSPEEAAYMEFRADEYAAGRIPCAFEEWKERFWDKRSEELPL